jgi:hypothetical protein
VTFINEKRFEKWAANKPFLNQIGPIVRDLAEQMVRSNLAPARRLAEPVPQEHFFDQAYDGAMRLKRPDIADPDERAKVIVEAERQAAYERRRFRMW